MAMMMTWPLFDIDGHRAKNDDIISGILRQLSMTTATTGAAAHPDDGNDTIVTSAVRRWWHIINPLFDIDGNGANNYDMIND